MKTLPYYTKVLTLGSSGTGEIFDGPVVLQEKIDGSQFRFGKNEDGEILFGSHRQNWVDPSLADKMFHGAVSYLQGTMESFAFIRPDTYLFAEYLAKPKHNTLNYARTPKNGLVLFDCLQSGRWVGREELREMALLFNVDLIPQFNADADGSLSVNTLRPLHDIESYLGGENIEGVVIKNYGKTIMLGGTVFPLFCKFVRSGFKERNDANFRATNPNDNLADYVNGFKNEARWKKAIQHMREDGRLTVSPKDIGPLIKEIQGDIRVEEAATIKDSLYKFFIDEITRRAIAGFPEWYKEQLLQNVEARS
jgi:hypothetical protein